MSFLQLNSNEPEIKRPFRLLDIQNIWSAIAQLFNPRGVDSDIRIVSGFTMYTRPDSFGITEWVYRAGVVAYKGNLYRYSPESDDEVITDKSEVVFAKVSTGDTRTFGDGLVQDFSYEFICGATLPSGVDVIESESVSADVFASKIPQLKTFIGITDKIIVEGESAPLECRFPRNTVVITLSVFDIIDYDTESSKRVLITGEIADNASLYLSIDTSTYAKRNEFLLPKIVEVVFQNDSAYSVRINVGNAATIDLPPSQIAVALVSRILNASRDKIRYALINITKP